ncbi:EF-hand domain-containing protein [Sphingosinicella terrae]|uniref:EF-hand domain-containing protein n=1 Tax=Sphingosinicella terrae TaxID=2172047 RepID=UPI000E0DF580|nr:EF-hand domain-containing protein [Sphingosinicella terrae]
MTFTLCLVAFALAAPALAAQRDRAAMLDQADANGDGAISRAEFAAHRLSQFDRADRDRDGAIARGDFRRLARFRPEAMERIDALIAQGDSNRDGRLTRAELQAAPMRIFDLADSDGDGRIDAAERSALRAAAPIRRR